jgi:hypothetical protein
MAGDGPLPANCPHLPSSSPGIAVRRTASLPLAYDRAIQCSRDGDKESRGRGVLDTPQEPVIGLAEGETRWRGMTAVRGASGVGPPGKSTGQTILPSSLPSENISLSPPGKSSLQTRPVPLLRGALRNVTDAERDAVDAAARLTGDAAGGRRSRVVLMPRRWHQVCGTQFPRNDGGKQARSPGRARRNPLKPLRGECRVFPV